MTRRRKPAEATLRMRAAAAAADRLQAILERVAADLKISVDSDRCRQIATLYLLNENEQAQLLRGDRVNPDDILKVDQALRQYVPDGKLQVEVTYVEGVQGTYRCSHCGEQNHLDPGTYTPAERPKPEVKPEPVPVAVASTPAPPKPKETLGSRLHYGSEGTSNFMGGFSRQAPAGGGYNPFGADGDGPLLPRGG